MLKSSFLSLLQFSWYQFQLTGSKGAGHRPAASSDRNGQHRNLLLDTLRVDAESDNELDKPKRLLAHRVGRVDIEPPAAKPDRDSRFIGQMYRLVFRLLRVFSMYL